MSSIPTRSTTGHVHVRANERITVEMVMGTDSSSVRVGPKEKNFDPHSKNEKYYADMLAKLRSSIKDKLPVVDTEEHQMFLRTCQATVAARACCDAAEAANKAAKSPEDKDATQKAWDQAQESLAKSVQVGVAVARPFLRKLWVDWQPNKMDHELVLCSVLYRATPLGLANFVQQGVEEQQLVDQLLSDTHLMTNMLEASGPANGKYGQAMQIYTSILKHIHVKKKASSSNNEQQDEEAHKEAVDEESVLHRLALAVSLELAEPIHVFDQPDVPIDPLERYSHYEQAYLANELDVAFPSLTAWEYRWVVNSDASSEQLKWGRQMLSNYYPDHITTTDHQWRYTRAVRTDVPYKHPSWTSKPRTYQQIISGGGECGPRAWFGRFITQTFGIPVWGCRQPGHAALTHWRPEGWVVCLGATWKYCWWNNRWGPDFLLETQARKANAAKPSSLRTMEEVPTKEGCSNDDSNYCNTVLRLEWIANALGENELDTMKSIVDPDSFWRSLALMQKHILAGDADSSAATTHSRNDNSSLSTTSLVLHPLPPGLATAKKYHSIQKRMMHLADNAASKVTKEASILPQQVNGGGTISIPAASCSKPLKSTKNFIFMKSFSGGHQIHHLNDEVFEYTLQSTGVPPGKYGLSLKVCTVHADNAHQPLLLTISSSNTDRKECHDDEHDGFESLTSIVSITTPYTMGMWEETKPVEIELFDDEEESRSNGYAHVLSFSRETPNLGLTIKEIILTRCSVSNTNIVLKGRSSLTWKT